MSASLIRLITAATIAGPVTLFQTPAAVADPPPPPPAPPYIPGDVAPAHGSFSYPYNVIVVAPPATVDARGVNVTANVDAAQSSTGLPGSGLGNSPSPPSSLTNSSALRHRGRYDAAIDAQPGGQHRCRHPVGRIRRSLRTTTHERLRRRINRPDRCARQPPTRTRRPQRQEPVNGLTENRSHVSIDAT